MSGQVVIIEPRANYVPNELDGKRVTKWVASGCTEADIAFFLQLDLRELRRHYQMELDHGLAFWVGEVGSVAIDRAMAGDGNMARLFLESKGQWVKPSKAQADAAQDQTKLEQRRELMNKILQRITPAAEPARGGGKKQAAATGAAEGKMGETGKQVGNV